MLFKRCFFTATLILVLLVDVAAACSCSMRSLGDRYRSAELVIHAMTGDVTISNSRRSAPVKVLERFHRSDKSVDQIWTPASSTACGFILEPNTEYLFFANSTGQVTKCGGYIQLDSLSDDEKSELVVRLRNFKIL